jgi:hypothetical protein
VFEAVTVIPDTDYFLAGDTKDLSVTRWKATDNKVVAELPINLPIPTQELYECEQIVVIPNTKLAMVHYDTTDHIIIMDYVTMKKIREIKHNPYAPYNAALTVGPLNQVYKEFKCDSTTYFSDKFRIACMQQRIDNDPTLPLNDRAIDIGIYNYATGEHVFWLINVTPTGTAPALANSHAFTQNGLVMFRMANVPQTPFFLGGMKFVISFYKMTTDSTIITI